VRGSGVRERHQSRASVRKLNSSRSGNRLPSEDVARELGFEKRVRGSHHLFQKPGVEERLNRQRDGRHAKPYQVRQVRAVVLRDRLGDAK